MKNPYEILGIPVNASIEQIDAAYREQMRLHGSNPAKAEELNAAYDAIILNPSAQSGYASGGEYSYNFTSDYSDVRSKISQNRLEDAGTILDGIPEAYRDAEWYYLKGTIQQKRGWLEEALRNFDTACNMEPANGTYKAAYNKVNSMRNGGYRTERKQNGGRECSTCEICNGLLCADCCCECMGGDLIPCC